MVDTTQKNIIRLDPRTALILLLIANIVAFTQSSTYIETAVIIFIALLLIACGCLGLAGKYIMIFCSLLVLQYYVIPHLPRILFVMLYMLAVFARKLFPCIMMGALILKTIPVRFLIIALKKWHIPQKIIIPLSITMRYFPAIKEEYRHIKDAMKLRKIRGLGKRLECTVISLLMSATSTADELSAAAITRGIENPVTKTCVVDLRLHMQDIISLCIGMMLMISAILVR